MSAQHNFGYIELDPRQAFTSTFLQNPDGVIQESTELLARNRTSQRFRNFVYQYLMPTFGGIEDRQSTCERNAMIHSSRFSDEQLEVAELIVEQVLDTTVVMLDASTSGNQIMRRQVANSLAAYTPDAFKVYCPYKLETDAQRALQKFPSSGDFVDALQGYFMLAGDEVLNDAHNVNAQTTHQLVSRVIGFTISQFDTAIQQRQNNATM